MLIGTRPVNATSYLVGRETKLRKSLLNAFTFFKRRAHLGTDKGFHNKKASGPPRGICDLPMGRRCEPKGHTEARKKASRGPVPPPPRAAMWVAGLTKCMP